VPHPSRENPHPHKPRARHPNSSFGLTSGPPVRGDGGRSPPFPLKPSEGAATRPLPNLSGRWSRPRCAAWSPKRGAGHARGWSEARRKCLPSRNNSDAAVSLENHGKHPVCPRVFVPSFRPRVFVPDFSRVFRVLSLSFGVSSFNFRKRPVCPRLPPDFPDFRLVCPRLPTSKQLLRPICLRFLLPDLRGQPAIIASIWRLFLGLTNLDDP